MGQEEQEKVKEELNLLAAEKDGDCCEGFT